MAETGEISGLEAIEPELGLDEISAARWNLQWAVSPGEWMWQRAGLLCIPMLLTGVSWLAGGIAGVTDIAMVALTIMCAIFAMNEAVGFTRHFRIGGFIIYGGTLVWFCHDYLSNWFMRDLSVEPFQAGTTAKLAFLTCVTVVGLTIGRRIRKGEMILRWAQRIPEAPNSGSFFIALVLLAVVGISPYYFFAREPFFTAVGKDMIAMRSGESATWTISRSGNLNYEMTAYYFRLLDLGYLSGILGALYALWVARGVAAKAMGWAIFVFWGIMAFGTGARGALVGQVAPAIGLVFLRYQMKATARQRRLNWRAYVYSFMAGVVLLVFVQFQGQFRDSSFEKADWHELQIAAAQGNLMFTEGLLAVELVPNHTPFFSNSYVVDGMVRCLWEFGKDFVLHPIPRALWRDKPVSKPWEWYNLVSRGGTSGTEGTTIAAGFPAWNYMCYGLGGVLVMSVLWGWMISVIERAFRASVGMPIQMAVSLAMATWMFRAFRGLAPVEFWAMIIGLAGWIPLVLVARILSPSRAPAPAS